MLCLVLADIPPHLIWALSLDTWIFVFYLTGMVDRLGSFDGLGVL